MKGNFSTRWLLRMQGLSCREVEDLLGPMEIRGCNLRVADKRDNWRGRRDVAKCPTQRSRAAYRFHDWQLDALSTEEPSPLDQLIAAEEAGQ